MSDEWFCQIFGNVLGPLSWGELSAMARDKSLMGDDLVRQGRDGEWTKANLAEGLFPRAKTEPPQSPVTSSDQNAVAVDSTWLADLDDVPVSLPDTTQTPDEEEPVNLLSRDREGVVTGKDLRPLPRGRGSINSKKLRENTEAEIAITDVDAGPYLAESLAKRPLPTPRTETIFSRSRDVLRSLSRRNQTLLVAVVLLVIGVGWFLSHQRRVTYRAAYLEVQRLHRHWQQAQAEPLDPTAAEAFQQKLHEQLRRVIEQLAGIRAGSAGGAVRDAATVLGELIELSNASEKATDRSQRTALETHFHDSMRQARQGLFAE